MTSSAKADAVLALRRFGGLRGGLGRFGFHGHGVWGGDDGDWDGPADGVAHAALERPHERAGARIQRRHLMA